MGHQVQERRLGVLELGEPLALELLGGHVAGHLGEPGQPPSRVPECGDRHRGPKLRAILAYAPALVLQRARLRGEVEVEGGDPVGLGFGPVEDGEVSADDLVLFVALDSPGPGVPADDGPTRVEQENGVFANAVDEELEPRGQLDVLGDLAVDLENDAALGVEDPSGVHIHVRPVLPRLDEQAFPATVTCNLLVCDVVSGRVASLEQLARHPTDGLLARITVHSLGSRVPVSDDMALRIDRKDGVVGDVQKSGRFGSPPFDPHRPKPTGGRSIFSAGDPRPQAQSRRILFIEDDRFIADMYRMKLESDGWNIEVAMDGEAGLRRALEDPPSLVLLDLLLPRMDGIEVLRQLREADQTRTVPVLILSNALGLAGRESEARSLGIVDWAVKANTTPAALSSRVARILGD